MDTKSRIFKEYDFGDGKRNYLAISYSQLSTFIQCPRKWFSYYLCGKGHSSDTESTELGTQIHAAIEEFCYKKSQGYEWTIAESVKLVETNLNKRNIKFKEVDDEIIVDQHLNMAKSLVEGMQGLGELLQHCDVLAQELEFKLCFKLPFSVMFGGNEYKEVIINGFIDLLLKDRNTGGLIIIDHKTSKKIFSEDKLWSDYQFPIYQLVVLQLYNRLPEKCYYYFTRFDELVEVHPLVLEDKDSKVVKYFRSGKNKGKPKYKIKSVGEIEKELTKIFKNMYCPKKLTDYTPNATALCSWCNFSPWYGETGGCTYAQFYERQDIPLPERKLRSVKTI